MKRIFLAAIGLPLALAAQPPANLLVCENNGPCNAAWVFNGMAGVGTWFAQKSTKATLSIVRFEPDYIVIRRIDSAGAIVATYTGSPRGTGYSGTIVRNVPGQPGATGSGKWTASVPDTSCANKPDLNAEDAIRIGQYGLMFNRERDALECYTAAAQAGDATAQTAVGLMYYQGRPKIPQDYNQAFPWLHKAADQGVYAAQRTVAEMYEAGQGTPRDATLAKIYNRRADEQKHDLERRQDANERRQEAAADRMNRLLSSFVLGASFGLMF